MWYPFLLRMGLVHKINAICESWINPVEVNEHFSSILVLFKSRQTVPEAAYGLQQDRHRIMVSFISGV